MSTFPRSALATAAIFPALIACSAAVRAHGSHDHSPRRQILGIHSYDPAVKPDETWGTYCVTELAPFFREAIALNAKSGVWPKPQ